MIISINQPAYMPWMGYFDRIIKSDVHIILDHVQFEKNSFINRNRILIDGQLKFLTVPVKTSGRFKNNPIKYCEISGNFWAEKHLRTIRSAYQKAQNFKDIYPYFEQYYSQNFNKVNLIDILLDNLNLFSNIFNIKTKFIRSSNLNLKKSKSELILEICQMLGANVYLSGPLGSNYLDLNSFKKVDIDVINHFYDQPIYKQLNIKYFQKYTSVIDVLMNNLDEVI